MASWTKVVCAARYLQDTLFSVRNNVSMKDLLKRRMEVGKRAESGQCK